MVLAKMTIKELQSGIYLVSCKTQRHLAHTFMRFQEHYESPNPEFRKRPFSRREYIAWYRKKFGQFSYYSDWSGFNIPGYILKPFMQLEFKHITVDEGWVLTYFGKKDLDKVYIIGVSEDNGQEALDHEMAHAFFHLNQEYREKVTKALESSLGPILKRKLRSFLLRNNYCEEVVIDEMNAYIMFDRETLDKHGIHVPRSIVKRLDRLFKDVAEE